MVEVYAQKVTASPRLQILPNDRNFLYIELTCSVKVSRDYRDLWRLLCSLKSWKAGIGGINSRFAGLHQAPDMKWQLGKLFYTLLA